MTDWPAFRNRILTRLTTLYPERAEQVADRIVALCRRYGVVPARGEPALRDRHEPALGGGLWDERDVVLITYGDQVQDGRQPPLRALDAFLRDYRLEEVVSTLHLLPFFPYSSDDGFSVIDYRQVDPRLGGWEDVRRLGRSFSLMFDLVLNHCSRQSEWFQKYVEGVAPYTDYFIEVDPESGSTRAGSLSRALSMVTRPRSTPLLTPVETGRGTRHVWTTFSEDQVDLNYASPDVLLEMLDVLLGYVARGARIIRLDAIAYLWKRPGTPCIHLPETHAVVKLMRDVVEQAAPGTILLTETNVPHEENVSYFGNGDEAQMVYNFSLAPLLLDAFLMEDEEPLVRWLTELEPAGPGRAYFNFTASHDGIGLRPLEGLVEPKRLQRLVEAVRRRGGLVSTRRRPDGTDSPYELNITWFSALGPPARGERPTGTPAASKQPGCSTNHPADSYGRPRSSSDAHVRRFLSTQAVMLALRGIPGVYFHSLVGTENYQQGVAETGRARTINRRKFLQAELEQLLGQPDGVGQPDASASGRAPPGSGPARLGSGSRRAGSLGRAIFDGYRHMLAVRRRQPAFHPEAPQTVMDLGLPGVVAFTRSSLDSRQRVVVLSNVTSKSVSVDLSRCGVADAGPDLLGNAEPDGDRVRLPAWGTAWLQS